MKATNNPFSDFLETGYECANEPLSNYLNILQDDDSDSDSDQDDHSLTMKKYSSFLDNTLEKKSKNEK